MQTFLSLFRHFSFSDAIDIVLVSVAFFLVLTIVRQSRSAQALRGLIITALVGFGLYLLSQVMQLSATSRLLESFWIVGVLVFLICFQAEVKKSLSEFGRVPLFRTFFKQKPGVIEDIISAAVRLSESERASLDNVLVMLKLEPTEYPTKLILMHRGD